MNVKKYAVLYVDDDVSSLKYFEKMFGKEFTVLIANNANDGYKILQESPEEIGVLLTDERMPRVTGVDLLEKSKNYNPAITRLIVTAYADHEASIRSINQGKVFSYIEKPVETEIMKNELLQALEFYEYHKVLASQKADESLKEFFRSMTYLPYIEARKKILEV